MHANHLDTSVLVRRHSSTLWKLFFVAAIVIIAAAIFSQEYWALGIPALFSIGVLALIKPHWIYWLLLIVLPFSIEYSIGSFSTDLPSEPLAILLAVVFVFRLLLYRDQSIRSYLSDPIIVLVILQFVWILITSIFSVEPLISLKFLAAKWWYLSAFLGMSLLMIRSQDTIKRVFWLFHIPIIIAIIIVLTRHVMMGFNFDEVNKSVSVLFRNHVTYGVFIAMWLPWQMVARSWYKKGSIVRLFLQISILITLVAIYFSYTRGAWLAVIALPVYLLIIKHKLSKWVLSTALVCAVIFGIYLHHNNHYLKYAPNFDTTIYHNELSEHLEATFSGEDMSTMERFHRWVGAVRMAEEKPLTGYGPGNFSRYYKPYTISAFSTYISDNEEMSTVHNYFLLMLAEQGVIGLLIFLLFTMMVFLVGEKAWHQYKEPINRNLIAAMMCCILVFYINNFFSDLFESNKVAPLFFISLAILINFRLGLVTSNKKGLT